MVQCKRQIFRRLSTAGEAVGSPEPFTAGGDWLMSGIDIDQPKAFKAQ